MQYLMITQEIEVQNFKINLSYTDIIDYIILQQLESP